MTEPQPESTHPLAHRADHLAPHKWKPGQSGNPAGRKPRPLLSEELHEVLGEPVDPADLASKSKLRALAEKIVELATGGNVKAAELLSKLVEPRRMRAEVENYLITGDVNLVENRLTDFVVQLPRILAEAGLPQRELWNAVKATSKRFGPMPPDAMLHMIDQLRIEDLPPRIAPDDDAIAADDAPERED